MKIALEDIRRLASAAADAGEDLFCIAGLTPAYKELAARYAVPGEPALLLLPGPFAPDVSPSVEDLSPRFARTGFPPLQAVSLPGDMIAADVRLLGDGGFRAFCEERGTVHLLVPFAELADGTEYGFRAAYGWIGEWRASTARRIRVTALFSAPPEDHGRFVRLFGSPGCVVIDDASEPEILACGTESVRKKYAYTLTLAQRHAVKRTAVFFTDRREAEEFLRLLQRRGIDAPYVNGALTEAQLKEALRSFGAGGVLVATKSALPSLPFCRADEAIFCGVPYSRAFLTRCASFAAEGALTCCYCPEDTETDINILKCFAENRPEEEREAFLTETLQKLLDVKQLLTGSGSA